MPLHHPPGGVGGAGIPFCGIAGSISEVGTQVVEDAIQDGGIELPPDIGRLPSLDGCTSSPFGYSLVALPSGAPTKRNQLAVLVGGAMFTLPLSRRIRLRRSFSATPYHSASFWVIGVRV